MPADIASRSERFKTWAYVEGYVIASTRDLPAKMEKIYDSLRKAGWLVTVESIDIEGESASTLTWVLAPAIALATSGTAHKIQMYLHRLDRYTPEDAKRALLVAIGQEGIVASLVAYAGAAASSTATATSEVVVQSGADAVRAAAEAARLAAEAGKGVASGVAKAASSGWLPWAIGGALVLGILAYVSPWLPKPSRQER
jgi:hypothetical protein